MTLVFFAYPIAAFMAHPRWGDVAMGAFVPKLSRDPNYIFLVVGLVGPQSRHTCSFSSKALSWKGVEIAYDTTGARRRLFGRDILTNLMSIFMIIATAATLHAIGKNNVETAADAARALEPVAGHFAGVIFAVGLVGASLLAAAVLPLATSYAVSEAFGFSKGVGLDFRRARLFFTLFTALIIFGAAAALIPNLPVIKLLVWIQVLNGVLLPIFLVFILLLVNDERLTKELKNTRLYNILGWATFAMITIAVVVMLLMQFVGLLGIKLFAS